jgi:hypothetical protein
MTRKTHVLALISVSAAIALTGCGGSSQTSNPPTVFQANGADAAAIQSEVDSFRSQLGANNGVGAASNSGRREVNWDAIPASALDPFPSDFFVTTSPRGVRFTTPGDRMAVSGDPGTESFKFANITAQQWGLLEFGFFSPSKMFATIGSVVTDVTFRVPGTHTPATVNAFGVVMVDVDVANATKLEFYDHQDNLILTRFVVPAGVVSEGLSFVGVRFNNGQRIGRVRIFAGTHPIDTPFQDPPPDGVGIDDVIYSEPVAL